MDSPFYVERSGKTVVYRKKEADLWLSMQDNGRVKYSQHAEHILLIFVILVSLL